MFQRRHQLRQRSDFLYCSFLALVLLTACLSLYLFPSSNNPPIYDNIVADQFIVPQNPNSQTSQETDFVDSTFDVH